MGGEVEHYSHKKLVVGLLRERLSPTPPIRNSIFLCLARLELQHHMQHHQGISRNRCMHLITARMTVNVQICKNLVQEKTQYF